MSEIVLGMLFTQVVGICFILRACSTETRVKTRAEVIRDFEL